MKKSNLQAQTLVAFFATTVQNGWDKLKADRERRVPVLLLAALLLLYTLDNMLRCLLFIPYPLAGFAVLMWGIVYAAVILALLALAGNFLIGQKYANDFIRVGFVNSAGEPPLLLNRKVLKNGICCMTFWGKGFPLSEWERQQSMLDSALEITTLGFAPSNKSNRCMTVNYLPGCSCLPEWVEWDDSFLQPDDFTLVLGQTVANAQAVLNLAKTPHALIAGATGMGKSELAKNLAYQILAKGAELVIADWKGGLDYPKWLRDSCRFADNGQALQQVLDEMQRETLRRKELLRDAGCSNIREYNQQAAEPLCRQVLLIDEASLLFDASHRPKAEKEAAYRILGSITDMARLCRAYGQHLLVATQRASVESLPGILKANLDGRICAHMADNQSSIVALDDASAANLPAIPGRFLLRTGSGPDITFQAYLMPDEPSALCFAQERPA